MQRIFIFVICVLSNLVLYSQTTILQKGKEFFNGDDRHLRVYLNNNYQQLDPIEGIWLFTRVEYNDWGVEVSRTPNEITAAIIRDPGNLRRAFIEVNMSRAFCKDYQITYSIQTGGGSGYYPCEPEGCGVVSGQYYYDPRNKTLSRPAVGFVGSKAILIGLKTFPQGPPVEMLPYPTNTANSNNQREPTPSKNPPIVTHESGWEPYIDWGRQIFSSYILSMSTVDPKRFPSPDDYLGDPLSVVGILIKNPKYDSNVEIEIEPTKFTKGIKETFTLDKRGQQYAIFPKIPWNYELLRCHKEAVPIDFTFRVSINSKAAITQTATANLRAIDDCPIGAYDYRGQKVDLKFMVAAYVNEGSPIIKDLTKEVRNKGLVRDFTGIQGEDAYSQVYAFWKILRDKGISYSSITNNGQGQNPEVNSQRIRLLEDVMDETQANCIDGTALLASCLSPIGIPTTVVLVPHHAFLGYYTIDKDQKVVDNFIETTMLGSPIEAFPPEFEQALTQEPYSTMQDILYKKFHTGKKTRNREIDHFIMASMIGKVTFLNSIEKTPDEVVVVDINKARTLVLPISRCGENHSYPTQLDGQGNRILGDNTPQKNPEKISVEKSRPIPTTVQKPLNQVKRIGTEEYDNSEFLTGAPDISHSTYKVQIEFTGAYQENKPQYIPLKEFGEIYAEYLLESKVYRIVLGTFETKESAYKAAKKAQSLNFKNVAIVRYEKGNRFESIYRGW